VSSPHVVFEQAVVILIDVELCLYPCSFLTENRLDFERLQIVITDAFEISLFAIERSVDQQLSEGEVAQLALVVDQPSTGCRNLRSPKAGVAEFVVVKDGRRADLLW
jgi:hypothetical protein